MDDTKNKQFNKEFYKIYRDFIVIQMSQKKQKFKVVEPVKGNKKKKKQKLSEDDSFIVSDSDIDEHKPKRKRLKKLKQSEEQEEFLPKQQHVKSQFQDDSFSEEQFDHKNKNQKIDKKEDPKNKKYVQLSIMSAIGNSGKKKKPSPEKPKYQSLNAGKSEEEAFQLALKASMNAEKQKPSFGLKSLADYEFGKNQPKVSKVFPKTEQKEKRQKKEEKKVEKSKSKPRKKQEKSKKEGPFSGQTIVLTGEFQPYSKMKIIEVLQQLGANCPKSLTKKATVLLQGCYVIDQWKRKIADNAKQTAKSKEAVQRGIRIVANEDINDFFVSFTDKTLQQIVDGDKNQMEMEERSLTEKIKEMSQEVDPYIIGQSWTQKYKPKNMGEIIGQQQQIKNLREWLQSWEDIHIRGNKREVKGSFNIARPTGNINSKAALISGDAGIGKTTTARLIAKQYNYKIVEFNASDIRNKKSINLLQNKNNLGLSGASLEKVLLVMDEVDGMSSGDRGGIASIIATIKNTKVPIICICNDRDSQKIKSLGGHCNDIKFHKPDKRLVVKRLNSIIEKQGGTSTDKGLERIVEIFQNDIRQILTYLQIFFRTVSKNIAYDTVDKRQIQSKDISLLMNHFQACKNLLNRMSFRGLTIRQRINLGFIDSDFVPLMCHENYLSSAGKKKQYNSRQFSKIVKATEGFVTGDLINKRIRKDQNWVLMPNLMFNQCVYPAQMVSQSLGFPKFTSWLGKFSSERKNRRLIKELKYCLALKSLVSWKSVKYLYVPLIYETIYQKLKTNSIEEIVEMMDFYDISPTHLAEHLQCLQLGDRQNIMKDVPAAMKAKLTKTYNKFHQTTKFKKQKGKVAVESMSKFDPVLGEFENLKLDDDEEEEMEVEEVVQKKKKKK